MKKLQQKQKFKNGLTARIYNEIQNQIIPIRNCFNSCNNGILWVFYPIKLYNAQFVPLVQGAIWLGVITILLITFFFGRFYCSILCPFGILQEFISFLFNRKNSYTKNFPAKYFVASLCFGSLLGRSTVVIKIFEPYTLFSKILSFSTVGIFALFGILALVYYKNRFFLHKYFDDNSQTAKILKNRCKKCGMCAVKCPYGAIGFTRGEFPIRL